jgi:ubiquinone biosynthesis protein UbiJ
MHNTSPFSAPLNDFQQILSGKRAAPVPPWVVQELQQRLVLLLNHVLQQEPAAMLRLKQNKGQRILARWQAYSLFLLVTPAGLFDLADAGARPDLSILLADEAPLEIARRLMQGEKPTVHIEGDVQLAAEVNWLADHVRWDLEEDLARLLGDVPAHLLAQAAAAALAMLRTFAARSSGAFGSAR